MKEYIFLFRGGREEMESSSPEQSQAHMQRWMDWMGSIGLVYVDFDTQKRIVKSSGHWYAKFLKSKVPSGVVNISNTA